MIRNPMRYFLEFVALSLKALFIILGFVGMLIVPIIYVKSLLSITSGPRGKDVDVYGVFKPGGKIWFKVRVGDVWTASGYKMNLKVTSNRPDIWPPFQKIEVPKVMLITVKPVLARVPFMSLLLN